ncbi:MAG TPA: hypothetical protein VM529_02250 [Gemmata sp.]|nr:hypothetical protein [Gemmata sp.]
MSQRPAPDSQAVPDRVRRMRAARGACWVIVGGAVGASGLVLLDAAAGLPGWVRGFALATWLTGVGVLAWRFVLGPWREQRAARGPAAAEELPGNLRAAAAAALSLVVCLVVATLLPGAADHLRRVAFPWQRGEVSPYRVVVTSADAIVRRGGTVTLSAYVSRADDSLRAAGKATFVIRTPQAREARLVVPAGAGGEFHVTRPAVAANFEYRVEVAGSASEWFTVTAIDPVQLADGSVTELLSPAYAPAAGKQVRPGFAPLDGIAQATAEYRLRFDRPAAGASLEFLPRNGPIELTAVAISEEGLTGTASFRLRQDGILRLVLVTDAGGKKLRTETPATVRVQPDRPPRFVTLRGVPPRPATVRPGSALAIEVAAADDVAVGGVVLEYTRDTGGSPVATPVTLTGAGTPEARGRLEFTPPAPLRAGEELRYRLRVRDTRRVEETGLKPQETVYPEEGWLVLHVDPAAPPIEEQEITARRDAVRDSLARALEEVRGGAEAVEAVLAEDRGQATLATENTIRLTLAREAAARAAAALRAAAQESDLSPELRPLAAATGAAAERLAKNVDEAARAAAAAPAAERAEELATAARHLANAADRIDAALALNDRAARDRLDARSLATLAADWTAHAGRLGANPPADAARAHRELVARFEKLLADSAPLRTALDGARYLEFQRLAAATTDLASEIGSLNAAAQRLHADTRAKLLGWVARGQETLADRAEGLVTRVETAARLAGTQLPKRDRFRKVPELLTRGRTLDALTEMAGLAQALDVVAGTFDKWATDRGDTKTAVRHLALWQGDLHDRFRAATAGAEGALPGAEKARLCEEQTALAAAFAAVRLPPGRDHRERRDAALEYVLAAKRFLDGGGAGSGPALEVAARELAGFADRLPAVPERLARTRGLFDKLWREQEQIQTGAEQAVRATTDPATLAKKLAPLADRQRAQLAAFEALDLPGLDARRARVAATLAAAATDLASALPHDVPASQSRAKRELDWVRTVISDNEVPPDDRADQAARRLGAAARAVEELGLAATDAQLAVHAAAVRDVHGQLHHFSSLPEAATLIKEFRDAVQSAELAFRNGSPLAEKTRRLRVAAAAAELLARRLCGTDSDLDRLRHLAVCRRAGAAAAAAQREKKEPPGPTAGPEVVAQLTREIDELTHTRVGATGQAIKKRTLDQYARLRDGMTPDRMAGLHADVATALEELAALAAEVADLTATFDRARPPVAPSEANAFLPSRPLADELREVAGAYRAARESVADIRGTLAARLRPTDAAPLVELGKRQTALAERVAGLATRLSGQSKLWPAHPDEVAAAAADAAKLLRDGDLSGADEAARRAESLLRRLATDSEAKRSAELVADQAAVVAAVAKLLDSPGVAAARQRLRSEELAGKLAALVRELETAARDAGPDEAITKPLAEGATAAGSALRLFAAGAAAGEGQKFDDAANLRAEAGATLRGAAGVVAGAGPVTTTLPNVDEQTAVVGESLRRADAAMRQAERALAGKADAAKAAGTVAAELDRAARAAAARLAKE